LLSTQAVVALQVLLAVRAGELEIAHGPESSRRIPIDNAAFFDSEMVNTLSALAALRFIISRLRARVLHECRDEGAIAVSELYGRVLGRAST